MKTWWVCSFLLTAVGLAGAAQPTSRPSLQAALADLKIPPDWFNSVTVHWDMNKPWKEGRLEIRRLLALDDASVREAVKMTWLYARKGDIGDGHELPMYLFMSGNYAWATVEYPRYLQKVKGTGATHAYMCYASCLAHFGEYDKALAVLDEAMTDIAKPPWTIRNQANINNLRGDIYAMAGDIEKAKAAYAEAIRLLPLSKQPYGQHLLGREVAKIRTKLKLLSFSALDKAQLRDGTYRASTFGYVEDKPLEATVKIAGGRIADIQLRHFEKIDLNATKIIPARIIEKQSLNVDAVTGATVTSHGIVDAVYQALQKAGLK
jgi:uncharacterized protein with FMN-binding domain